MPTTLENLRPVGKPPTVMSILNGLGFNVQPWRIGRGGSKFPVPARNPKFCYEWVHHEGEKIAINLWHQDLNDASGHIRYIVNPTELRQKYAANKATSPGKLATVVMRSERTHEALKFAASSGVPLRAIITDGKRRTPDDPSEVKSKVKARALDTALWHVEAFDEATGRFVLVRSASDVEDTEGPFLVLTENEVHAGEFNWKDVTGERYQFPNKYRNMIVPGARFVYYKGDRRVDGSRGGPVYFGWGVIGDVYPDPETIDAKPSLRKWLADIAEYEAPPRQNSCRPDRTEEPGGDDERTSWHDTDKHSRTERWRGCCRRRALRSTRSRKKLA